MNGPIVAQERELTIVRVFDAPRELVWRMWTDPLHARRWWGPRHHPATHLELDARVGGRFRGRLTNTETGRELWQGGVFREVQKPERLVFTFKWDDGDGPAEEMLVTITFAEQAGRTRMTFHQAPFVSADERDGHIEGWNSMFDRLVDELTAIEE
jgi:uncharacterized protein YndB with AHSA1/START domain